MKFAPRTPEGIVSRLRFKEVSDLVHVVRPRVAAKQVTQQVKGGIAEAVGAAEDRHSVQLNAARPEVLDAGRGEAFGIGVPESEVEIDTGRDAGIEVVAMPLPAGFADHRRNVVDREAFGAFDGLIAKRLESFTRRLERTGRSEQIDVIGYAKVGIGGIFHFLREALDEKMLDTPGIELFDDFDQRGAQAAGAFDIVGEITLDALRDPCWKKIAARGAKQKREAGAVGKSQRGFPLGIGEAAEQFGRGCGEAKGGQCRGDTGGQATVVFPRKRHRRSQNGMGRAGDRHECLFHV